ncbi:MAG TPA: hypothetical protein VGI88_08760 [Verrucomicrobiae bacterium]|jgi:hypothetical protein
MGSFKPRVAFSIAATFLLGHGIAGFAQGALHITFDEPPTQARGTGYEVTYYYEAGMVFTPETNTPGSQFIRIGGGISGMPEDGTAYLQEGTGLIFSFTNGLSFSLISVDLAGYSDVVPDLSIDFVGYKSDGSIVTNSFSGSGIDFETYNFGPEFTNLTRVEVFGDSWSLDNLVVQPCPPVLSVTMVDFLTYFPPGSDNVSLVPIPMLTFSTISNQTYALEFSPDLGPGSWSNLPGIDQNAEPASNMVGDGGQTQLIDTNAITITRRFYRVRLLP